MNSYINSLRGPEKLGEIRRTIHQSHLDFARVPFRHPCIFDRDSFFRNILRELGILEEDIPYNNPEFWKTGKGKEIRSAVQKKAAALLKPVGWLANIEKSNLSNSFRPVLRSF